MSFWDTCLKKHYYETPASLSLVEGKWKTGKTDFALFLSVDELKNRLGFIEEVASNVKTFNNETVYIDNFIDLEMWMFKNRKRKIFIYDEAIKATPSRRAMSEINTKWLQFVPELSKGKCHLIVVTQEPDYTEKLFLHPTFVRAHWIKRDLKTVDLISQYYKGVNRFHDLPKTSVNFDPYLIAVWKLEAEVETKIVDEDIKIALDYAQGMRSHAIMQKYGLRYRNDLTLAVRRAISKLHQMYMRRERVSETELTTTTP